MLLSAVISCADAAHGSMTAAHGGWSGNIGQRTYPPLREPIFQAPNIAK